jgi:ABC-2 type transport system permease protein
MWRYIKLYAEFMRVCAIREMEARGNFVIGSLVILCFPFFPLLLIGAIYGRINSLGGWTLYEYFILVGSFQIIGAFVLTMFFKNIFGMPEYVRKGELDFFLLKPVNSQFMLTTRYLSFTEFPNAISGIVLLVIGIVNLNLTIEWWRWLLYPVFLACGVIIAYSIWFMLTLPCIWWVRNELQEFFFGLFEIGRYHPSMFSGIVKGILIYVIPVGVIASTPADLLLNRLSWEAGLWAVGIAAGLLFISNRFWRFAQSHYYGASS